MKISQEASKSAEVFMGRYGDYDFYNDDRDDLAATMQSLINSTLERAAGVAYATCAATRHVTLGDKAATAIRQLIEE